MGRGEKGGATLFCPTHPRNRKAGGDTSHLGDVGLKGGLGVVLVGTSVLSTFSVRQHGGAASIQYRVSKTHTHTLNDKGVVWLWHRRAGQAVEAPGRLNSGRKESRLCCVDIQARV